MRTRVQTKRTKTKTTKAVRRTLAAAKKAKTTAKRTRVKKAAKRDAKTEIKDEAEIQGSTETIESAVNNSFFYTSDKFFDQLDQADILESVIQQYPGFSTDNDDSTIKQTLVQILDDDAFMTKTLRYYNITIFDFFKMLYKNYASIFKGPYLKKIRHEVEAKAYSRLRLRERGEDQS